MPHEETFTAGPLTFAVKHELWDENIQDHADQGVAILVRAQVSGKDTTLLRFNCFDVEKSYDYGPENKELAVAGPEMLGGSMLTNHYQMDPIACGNPIGWSVKTLGSKLEKMLDRAGYPAIAKTVDYKAVKKVLPEVEASARELYATKRNTVKHNRGTDIFECGNIRFGLEMRRLPMGDGGLAIHVLADIGGTPGKKYMSMEDDLKLDKRKNHTIEVVIDRLLVKPGIEHRLEQSVALAMKLANGLVQVVVVGGEEYLFSERLACPECGISVPVLEPRSFSFNSVYGACPECHGLGSRYDFDPAKVINDWSKPLFDGALGPGSASANLRHLVELGAAAYGIDINTPVEKLPVKQQNLLFYGPDASEKNKVGFRGILEFLKQQMDESSSESYREYLLDYMSATTCTACHGKRLRPESLAVKINGMSIADFTALPVSRAVEAVKQIKLNEREEKIAGRVVREIAERLGFLNTVGLGYMSLDRSAATLSGGEGQRIRLATQIGSRLRGVLYVLDEPSIGLHHRDNERLLKSLESLRDLGNTVLVVEHDEETIRRADYVIDLGPGAGRHGGELVASGTPDEVMHNPDSLTGKYISGEVQIEMRSERRHTNGNALTILGAKENNLKHLDVTFPLGVMTVVTGVSGSGKSTLVNDILYRALAQRLYRSREMPGEHKSLTGIENIDKVIRIDQSPIGRTPRSNPATYTGVFTQIRELFAMLPEARERGYKAGRFSFNVSGGRCEACQGEGQRRIEMNFLPDVYVLCEVCGGHRYNQETLAVKYNGYSIADLLEMPVSDSLPILENFPIVRQKLQTLVDVGLGYIHLGQSAVTLSGGEAQRIKLARELSKRQTGRTLYLLDEPTTGLHFDDVRKLLDVLHRLTDLGNSIIIIEHNLDVIRNADWIIDLGPEGGEDGGRVVAQGTPEQVAKVKKSYTGQALAHYFGRNHRSPA